MKKTIISAGTVGAAGVVIGALGLFGAGIASAAPDVVGMTYGDAVSAIEEDGGTAKIAVTVGDRQDSMGDCLITNATDAPFIQVSGGGEFGHADGLVLLTLNCNRGAATAATPGASAASPEGRDFTAKAEEAAADQQSEEAELAEAGSTPGETTPEIPTG